MKGNQRAVGGRKALAIEGDRPDTIVGTQGIGTRESLLRPQYLPSVDGAIAVQIRIHDPAAVPGGGGGAHSHTRKKHAH